VCVCVCVCVCVATELGKRELHLAVCMSASLYRGPAGHTHPINFASLENPD
jgi:hypothetical protein